MASLLSFSLLKPNTMCKATSISAAPTSTSSLVESLNDQFGRKGIKFLDFSELDNNISPSVELSVRNGSTLKLQISNAHISSYKPKVYWKEDGFEEVLYTLPQDKGGVALVLHDVTAEPVTSPKTSVLSECQWSVTDADSDSFDAVQAEVFYHNRNNIALAPLKALAHDGIRGGSNVELSCTSGTLEITYVVSLYMESMASAVIVKNKGKKPINLTSAILSHFKLIKRSGSAIQGLQGCSYNSQPSLPSPFEILSPSESMKADEPGFFSIGSEQSSKPGEWSTQHEPITILRDKISRVYSSLPSERSKAFFRTPPSKYEVIDQGKELFYRVIRMGYDDIYLSAPGSYSSKYGRDYFICTGPASMLAPVTVNPEDSWKGALVIEHDNLT